MWSYRTLLKFSWTEKVKNEEILQRMNEKRKLINILREKKLRSFGHLIRLNNIYRTLLEGYVDGRRGRGHPRMNWYNDMKEWTDMRYELATRIAMDRDKWRATVSSNIERCGTWREIFNRGFKYHVEERKILRIIIDGTCIIIDGETSTLAGKQQKQAVKIVLLKLSGETNFPPWLTDYLRKINLYFKRVWYLRYKFSWRVIVLPWQRLRWAQALT